MPSPYKPVTHSDPSVSNASATGEPGELTRLTLTAGVAVPSVAAEMLRMSLLPSLAIQRLLWASNVIPISELKSPLDMVCKGAMVSVPAAAALIAVALYTSILSGFWHATYSLLLLTATLLGLHAVRSMVIAVVVAPPPIRT